MTVPEKPHPGNLEQREIIVAPQVPQGFLAACRHSELKMNQTRRNRLYRTAFMPLSSLI
jgi:hypothetical protein